MLRQSDEVKDPQRLVAGRVEHNVATTLSLALERLDELIEPTGVDELELREVELVGFPPIRGGLLIDGRSLSFVRTRVPSVRIDGLYGDLRGRFHAAWSCSSDLAARLTSTAS